MIPPCHSETARPLARQTDPHSRPPPQMPGFTDMPPGNGVTPRRIPRYIANAGEDVKQCVGVRGDPRPPRPVFHRSEKSPKECVSTTDEETPYYSIQPMRAVLAAFFCRQSAEKSCKRTRNENISRQHGACRITAFSVRIRTAQYAAMPQQNPSLPRIVPDGGLLPATGNKTESDRTQGNPAPHVYMQPEFNRIPSAPRHARRAAPDTVPFLSSSPRETIPCHGVSSIIAPSPAHFGFGQSRLCL